MTPQHPSPPPLANGHHGSGEGTGSGQSMGEDRAGNGGPSQTRTLLVRDGPALRELADAIRRAAGSGARRLEEVDDLYEALTEIISGVEGVALPVRSLAVTLRGTGDNALVAREAVRVIDPSIHLVLLCPRGSMDTSRAAGFDQVVPLPAGSTELAAALQITPETDDTAPTHPPTAPWQTRRGPAGLVGDGATADSDPPRPPHPMPQALPFAQKPASTDAPPPVVQTGARSVVEMVIDDAMQAFAARRDRLPERRAGDTPRRPEQGAESAPADAPVVANESLGDTDLVDAVMAGSDRVLGLALSIIRRELAVDDLVFAPPGQASDIEPSSTLAESPVRQGARSFGTLRSRQASSASLAPWADWLSHWLRLDASHQELRIQAWTDELTGAGNRRAFERVLDETINEARRERRGFSLMYFDIDEFKGYNDRFGHEAGDEVLREVVELLRAVIRRGDHVFRVGGDEFVVIFADTRPGPSGTSGLPIESVATIANRFRDRVGDLKLAQLGLDAVGTLSVSAGIATYPWDGHDGHSLLSHADQLALQSKRSGKNTITFGPGARLFHAEADDAAGPYGAAQPSSEPSTGSAAESER